MKKSYSFFLSLARWFYLVVMMIALEPITIDFLHRVAFFYMFTLVHEDHKTNPIAFMRNLYLQCRWYIVRKLGPMLIIPLRFSGVFSVVTVDPGFQNINITLENDDITTGCVSVHGKSYC
jgi:hypothetical protein